MLQMYLSLRMSTRRELLIAERQKTPKYPQFALTPLYLVIYNCLYTQDILFVWHLGSTTTAYSIFLDPKLLLSPRE